MLNQSDLQMRGVILKRLHTPTPDAKKRHNKSKSSRQQKIFKGKNVPMRKRIGKRSLSFDNNNNKITSNCKDHNERSPCPDYMFSVFYLPLVTVH